MTDTDKYSLGYYPAYAELAKRIGPAGRVLEVGVAAGGSLRMWRELFPDGLIAGADLDPGCTWPEGTEMILATQDSPYLALRARELSPGGWDLIVDDASHVGELSERTFALLWPLVRPGGWYVLEDWPVAFTEPYASSGSYGGQSMLRLAQSWIRQLEPAPGAADMGGYAAVPAGSGIGELWYRFGQAMVHKVAE
jgi:hypothetical protein